MSQAEAQTAGAPRIIARADHCISRKNISKAALKVLYRLHEGGYQAFLVGGAVRDMLLGGHPKDFDIATDASPDDSEEASSARERTDGTDRMDREDPR